MLNDATCFKQVYIVCGYTDLRSGIDTLASIIDAKTDNSPFVPDTLYLFCGRKADRIKGLVWGKDGFLLLYKRLEQGKFVWPRNEAEVRAMVRLPLQSLMALFVEHISTLPADITSVLKSKVTEWIASQVAFIQVLFGNICWES